MASIIRNSITRSSRVAARRSIIAGRVTQPALLHFIRHNSSQTPSATKPPLTSEQIEKKQALKRQDDLQRDWDAKILSYEELVPITQSPTPVSLSSRCILREHFSKLNLVLDRIRTLLTFENRTKSCKG